MKKILNLALALTVLAVMTSVCAFSAAAYTGEFNIEIAKSTGTNSTRIGGQVDYIQNLSDIFNTPARWANTPSGLMEVLNPPVIDEYNTSIYGGSRTTQMLFGGAGRTFFIYAPGGNKGASDRNWYFDPITFDFNELQDTGFYPVKNMTFKSSNDNLKVTYRTIKTDKINGEQFIEGFILTVTPSGITSFRTQKAVITATVIYEDEDGKQQKESMNSDAIEIKPREATFMEKLGNASIFEFGTNAVVSPEVAAYAHGLPAIFTSLSDYTINGNLYKVGIINDGSTNFEAKSTTLYYTEVLELHFPKFSKSDTINLGYQTNMSADSINSALGTPIKTGIAYINFTDKRKLVSNNVTISYMNDDLKNHRDKTFYAYLVENDADVTDITVQGVKITQAGEPFKLSGTYLDTIKFPLVDNMLGTYVVTSAPLTSVASGDDLTEVDADDVGKAQEPDNNSILVEDHIDDAVAIPTTGSSDVVAVTVFMTIIALAAAVKLAVFRR